MISKIIQLSTKQCSKCQTIKSRILDKIKDTNIEYEYISLADETKEYTRDNIDEYWSEVKKSFNKYSNMYNIQLFQMLPSFIVIDENGKSSAPHPNILLDDLNKQI